MTNRYIIYKMSRVQFIFSYYTGTWGGKIRTVTRFRRDSDYPQWDHSIQKARVFKSWKEAATTKSRLILSTKDGFYGIDIHPEDRYRD